MTDTDVMTAQLQPTGVNYGVLVMFSVATARIGLQNDKFGAFIYVNNASKWSASPRSHRLPARPTIIRAPGRGQSTQISGRAF